MSFFDRLFGLQQMDIVLEPIVEPVRRRRGRRIRFRRVIIDREIRIRDAIFSAQRYNYEDTLRTLVSFPRVFFF